MRKINLSYVVTTRNKLPYLREAIRRLVAHVQADEEIVVIDGSSADGSAEYLKQLYNEGLIDQFLSEPDLCQAHGTNKGMLMARGELIKIVTDDDVYFYPGLRQCKEFLLSHPTIDVLNGNIGVQDRSRSPIRMVPEREKSFLEWLNDNGEPFWFSDHGLFFRREKLPLIGLWHTGVICIDVELTLRITALRQVNLTWYTGIVAIAIVSEDSNGTRFAKTVGEDAEKIYRFYKKEHSVSKARKILPLIGKGVRLLTDVRRLMRGIKTQDPLVTDDCKKEDDDVLKRFSECEAWLLANDRGSEHSFFYKEAVGNRRLLES